MGLSVTRELRLGVGDVRPGGPDDSRGLLRVSVTGPVRPESGYVMNVKAIDQAVIAALPVLLPGGLRPSGSVARDIWERLPSLLPAPVRPSAVELCFLPLVRYSISIPRPAVVDVTCRFEFAAGHRLYVPSLSEEENLRQFGKCVNWHGHNYVLEVTVGGQPDAATGEVFPASRLREVVSQRVLDRFDHATLNGTPEFASRNPTVENLAAVVWDLLDGTFRPAELQRVRIYETAKIWADLTRD